MQNGHSELKMFHVEQFGDLGGATLTPRPSPVGRERVAAGCSIRAGGRPEGLGRLD